MGFLQCRRPQFDSWVGKIPWRRDSLPIPVFLGFPCSSAGKESACNAGDGSIPGLGRSLGEGKGSSVLAWRIPWTIQSMGLQRVGHHWSTFTLFLSKRHYIWLIFQPRNQARFSSVQFSSVQSSSRIWLFLNPWTAACQASLSFTNSRSLLKLISIKSVMPSNYLILPAPYPPTFNLSVHILGSPLYSEIFVYVWPIFFQGFCNKNKKGDIQWLIVSHLLLWLSHEKSLWENNKSKIWQYSITKIKVHRVD